MTALIDFGLISLLMLLTHLLRRQSRVLQYLAIPTPILAGLLALLLGPQFARLIPFSDAISTYPSVLVVLLFATLFLGHRQKHRGVNESRFGASLRHVLRQVGDSFTLNFGSLVGQYSFSLLFGLLVIVPWFPSLNRAFALMLPAGFVGGPGTAIAMGETFRQHGWQEALDLGQTFSTIGMVSGIVGGLIMVRVGTHFGWTRMTDKAAQLPLEIRRGFVPASSQESMGRETVSPLAFDPLAWHFALVLATCGLAYFVEQVVAQAIAEWQAAYGSYFTETGEAEAAVPLRLPLFAVALLMGAVVQKFCERIGVAEAIDRPVMNRLGSCFSDYLIAFGIAAIRRTVVADYAWPLVAMSCAGLAWCVGWALIVGPRICRTFWFEKSLFTFGWNTGVVATGIALLRVVDPKLRSRTLEDYGVAYIALGPVEISLVIFMPYVVMHGGLLWPGLALAVLCLLALLSSYWLGNWQTVSRTAWRAGEGEFLATGEEFTAPIIQANSKRLESSADESVPRENVDV